ncbi:hypothetical protein [Flavobacterium sp.]|jgi:hypothetical protein
MHLINNQENRFMLLLKIIKFVKGKLANGTIPSYLLFIKTES